jgi:hypothetical protein
MTALKKHHFKNSVKNEIENNPAWLGHISGLKADKMLRNKKQPFLYVLRAGEFDDEDETAYYVTYVTSDFTVFHQPFVITVDAEGWYYENYSPGGPYQDLVSFIEEVLPKIMHCPAERTHECVPLVNFNVGESFLK